MTPTLESALAGLPAKPRVHELSKRIGISNKELIAALADRGLTVSSASSSVPLAVAQELIKQLVLVEDPVATDVDPVHDQQSAHVEAPLFEAPAEIPGDSPGQAGHAINPLFLPPAEFEGVAGQQGRVPLDQDAAEGVAGPQARSGSSRRRRGRSGGGRRQAPDSATQDSAAQDSADDEAPSVDDAVPVLVEAGPSDQPPVVLVEGGDCPDTDAAPAVPGLSVEAPDTDSP